MLLTLMTTTLVLSNSLDLLSTRLRENITAPLNALIAVSDIHSKAALQIELSSFGIRVLPIAKRAIAQEIHIFGLTAADRDLLDFYLSLGSTCYFYVLSPCMHFWSDICSDYEAKKLTRSMSDKARGAHQEYLFDRSKLLANYAVPIRETISYLIEKADDIREEYVIKEWMQNSPYVRRDVVQAVLTATPTLFDTLQADLLLLADSEKQQVRDATVEVHKAPTRKREVETLYQYIQKQLPAKIVVFAPDLSPYRPYIQSLFTHSTEIIGGYQYELLPLFVDILNGKSDKLFKNPTFQKKWGLTPDDLALQSYLKKDVITSWISEDSIPVQDVEALGKLLSVESALKQDFARLQQEKILPCSSWQRLFSEIFDRYFADTHDEYSLIKKAIIKAYHNDAEMALDEAVEAFKLQIEEPGRYAVQPIVFATLGSCRTVPRDVVCFLGMNEAALPWGSSHLVIEAIVAARSQLYISFQSYAFEERCAQYAHSIVHDIMAVVDVAVQNHTLQLNSHDPYEVSTSQQLPAVVEKIAPTTISINELSQVAKYPLRAYFQQGQGLYLYDNKPYRDDFDVLEQKNQYTLKHSLFPLSDQESKNRLQKQFTGLTTSLKEAYSMLYEEEREVAIQNAKELGIKAEEPLEVVLSPTAKCIEKRGERSWLVPALQLDNVQLVGTITNLYPQGIVLFEKKSKEAILKVWPELLLVNILQKELDLQPNVLFIRDAKKETVVIDDAIDRLKEYVAYALEARSRPSLLYPDLATSKDPYLELYRSRARPDVLEQDMSWAQSERKRHFGALL